MLRLPQTTHIRDSVIQLHITFFFASSSSLCFWKGVFFRITENDAILSGVLPWRAIKSGHHQNQDRNCHHNKPLRHDNPHRLLGTLSYHLTKLPCVATVCRWRLDRYMSCQCLKIPRLRTTGRHWYTSSSADDANTTSTMGVFPSQSVFTAHVPKFILGCIRTTVGMSPTDVKMEIGY